MSRLGADASYQIPVPNHILYKPLSAICENDSYAESTPELSSRPYSLALLTSPPVSALSAEQARVLAHLDSVLVVPEALQAENGECLCEAAQQSCAFVLLRICCVPCRCRTISFVSANGVVQKRTMWLCVLSLSLSLPPDSFPLCGFI